MSEPASGMPQNAGHETGSPSALAASSVRWQIVIMMMAFSFMNYFNRQTLPVAGVERIMKEYHVSEERLGVAYSAFLVTYTLAMIPGGWFVDRFGPKRTLVWLGLGTALAAMATGLWGHAMLATSGSLTALMISRAILGVFSAPIYPACARMASHWLPEHRRALATGLIIGSAPVGISATVFIFGKLMDWVGWPMAFVVAGIATAAVTVVWLVYAKDDPAAHPGVNEAERRWIETRVDRPGQIGPSDLDITDRESAARPAEAHAWKQLFTNRGLILLTLSYITVGYFEYLLYYWIQYYFEKVLMLSVEDSRFYSSIPPLAMAVAFPIAGWTTDRLRSIIGLRWSRSLVAIATMILSSLALALVPFTKNPVWLVIWFSLALGMTGASDLIFWTVGIELGGKRGGTASAICNFGGNAGGTVAQWISPWIATSINLHKTTLPSILLVFGDGWSTALAFGSFLCVIGALLWFWIDANDTIKC